MKRYLLNLLTVALAGAGLASSSCSDEETGEKVPAPNFPEKTALGIEVGGTCSIPIEPNQDWSVSIDQNEAGEWFWIDDDGMTAYTVRGKAGKHEVVIRVSDKEENDTDRSIDVSMTMGGQTQVIATVTRGKVERTFDLYLGKKNESGDFTPDSDGKFAYEETAADAATAVIDLKWPAEGQERPALSRQDRGQFPVAPRLEARVGIGAVALGRQGRRDGGYPAHGRSDGLSARQRRGGARILRLQ